MIQVVFSSVCKRMQIQFIGMKVDSSKTLAYMALLNKISSLGCQIT